MYTWRKILQQEKSLVIALSVLFFYFLPFLLEGNNSIISIHDNLDSSFSFYVILAREGKLLSLNPNAMVEGIMGGLPRMYFGNGFSYLGILCSLFTPFTAYLLNFITVHLVAFIGMYLLLRRYFLQGEEDKDIAIFVSLAFALLPVFSTYILSVTGLPLLFYSFLNLFYKRHSKSDFLIICLFPFFSSFMLAGLFVLAVLFIWLIADVISSRAVNFTFATGIACLLATALISEYFLIYQILFNNDVISHRTEVVFEKFDFERTVEMGKELFYGLHYHASNPPEFIIPILFFGLILGLAKNHKDTKWLVYLFLVNVIISLVHSLYYWNLFADLIKPIPFINSIQWDRFYFLSPLVWYIILAVSLKIIYHSASAIRYRTWIIVFLLGYQFYFIWRSNSEYRNTTYNLFSKQRSEFSFKEFYDEELFAEIDTFIGKPKDAYKVASIGLHPIIAQVNGFHTIDGYMPNYPLSYKQDFRKIIKGELDKNPQLKKYYDEWGSRCYLFTNATYPTYTITKYSGYENSSIMVNFDFTKGPAVDYIFSAVLIGNEKENNLQLLKAFETPYSKWKIYLYKNGTVNPAVYIKELNEKSGQEKKLIGVASELELSEEMLSQIKNEYKVMPRKELINSFTNLDMALIDGPYHSPTIIGNTKTLNVEDVGVHTLNSYWTYDNVILFIAVPGITETAPISFDKGDYELTVSGFSSIVDNVTSHIIFYIGDQEISQQYLPVDPKSIKINFSIDKSTTVPLKLKYDNDVASRDYWLESIRLKKIK